jgi:hypothetical protein
MNFVQNDIDTGTLKEANERNTPVAKLVKASDFHSDNRGFEPHLEYKNLDDEMIISNCEEEIGYMKRQDWFTIGAKVAVINGTEHTRLGFIQT